MAVDTGKIVIIVVVCSVGTNAAISRVLGRCVVACREDKEKNMLIPLSAI
jgi:hypothetical protein